MGVPARVLIGANVLGCALVALVGWVYWGLSHSEGDPPEPNSTFLVLGLIVFAWSVVTLVALVNRRTLIASGAFAGEVAFGVPIVFRGLDASVHGDAWLIALALAVGLSRAGAIVAANIRAG